MNTPKSTLVMFGIALGICLVVLNILLIACCLHKRHKKNLKGGNIFTLELEWWNHLASCGVTKRGCLSTLIINVDLSPSPLFLIAQY